MNFHNIEVADRLLLRCTVEQSNFARYSECSLRSGTNFLAHGVDLAASRLGVVPEVLHRTAIA